MQPFTSVTGVAAPFLHNDVNTDQIAPIQMSRALKPDYADLLFKRQRCNPDGSEVPGHILNQARYRRPAIFVGGRNFGCGSSREAAVWCLAAVGIHGRLATDEPCADACADACANAATDGQEQSQAAAEEDAGSGKRCVDQS